MRTSPEALIDAVLDEALLSFDDFCRAAAVSPQWLETRVSEGLLACARGQAPTTVVAHWRFDAPALRRARRMRQVERHYDAVPELAALVADLHDEIERLRAQLHRAAGRGGRV